MEKSTKKLFIISFIISSFLIIPINFAFGESAVVESAPTPAPTPVVNPGSSAEAAPSGNGNDGASESANPSGGGGSYFAPIIVPAPEIISINISPLMTSASFSVSVNPNGGDTKVIFEKVLGEMFETKNIGSGITPVTVLFNINNLKAGTDYSFKVRAVNQNNSIVEKIASFKTGFLPTIISALAVPNTTGAILNISVNPNGLPTKVIFEKVLGELFETKDIGNGIIPVNLTFPVNKLKSNSIYTFTVQVLNEGGHIEQPVKFKTLAITSGGGGGGGGGNGGGGGGIIGGGGGGGHGGHGLILRTILPNQPKTEKIIPKIEKENLNLKKIKTNTKKETKDLNTKPLININPVNTEINNNLDLEANALLGADFLPKDLTNWIIFILISALIALTGIRLYETYEHK